MVSIQLSAQLPRADLLDASQKAFFAIEKVHQALNFYAADSELSLLNASHPGCWHSASTAMFEVLQCALSISAQSAGVFDVCANTALIGKKRDVVAASWRDIELDHAAQRVRLHCRATLDFGGIAKGYAVDCAAEVLQSFFSDITNSVPRRLDFKQPSFSINAGGDLRLSDWRDQTAELRLPDTDLPITVRMRNSALASSSDEVSCRTIQVDQHRPARSSRCCYSVFAARCMHADALTKVLRMHPAPGAVLAEFGACGLITRAPNPASVTQTQFICA